jgi:Tfp pilus assembly protein PilV
MKFLNNFALFAVLLALLVLPFGAMGIIGVSTKTQEVLPASTHYEGPYNSTDMFENTQSTSSVDVIER